MDEPLNSHLRMDRIPERRPEACHALPRVSTRPHS